LEVSNRGNNVDLIQRTRSATMSHFPQHPYSAGGLPYKALLNLKPEAQDLSPGG